MRMARAIAFNLGFYGVTGLACILCLPLLAFPRGALVWAGKTWVRFMLAWLRLTCGLDHRLENFAALPGDGRYILAAKHQSAWETLALWLFLDNPAVILKRELTWLPIWGWFAIKTGQIAVDRGAGAKAMKALLRDGARRLDEGRPLIIFPQGTRVAPGARKPYQPGVAALYRALDVPVYPLALNSGLFWGRRSFSKHPGTIVARVLDPIEPGLAKRDFLALLEDRIERATQALADGAPGQAPIAQPVDKVVHE